MLRTGNLGLKMGVSRAAHTQYAYMYMEVPPPPYTHKYVYHRLPIVPPIFKNYTRLQIEKLIKFKIILLTFKLLYLLVMLGNIIWLS